MRSFIACLAALLCWCIWPASAFAHAVETNYLLGDLLEFQSAFSTGEPLQQAQVTIYAPNNAEEPWLEITTDDQGRFAFLPDQSIPGDWQVHIRQGTHEDLWTVPVTSGVGIDFNNISDASDHHPLIVHWPTPHGAGLMVALAAAGSVLSLRLSRQLRS